MRGNRWFALGILLSVLMVFGAGVVNAQDDGQETCPALVEEAINQVGTLCADLSRNNACYGNTNVQAEFSEAVEADYFTTPGSRANLRIVESLRTAPFDLDEQVWGISVMNIQANLPNSIPGQGVVMVLLGGVEIENGVETEDAFVPPASTLSVTIATDTQIFSLPPSDGRSPRPLADVPAGAEVTADAVHPTEPWARVVFEGLAGWVAQSAFEAPVSGLPEYDPILNFTPMQSYFMRVGIGGLECNEAPSVVTVQGPNGTPVDIRVHEQDIRIESTVVMRTFPPGEDLGEYMELIVISGLVRVFPDTPQEFIIPPGYVARLNFGDFVSLGIEGDEDEKTPLDWETPRPLTQEEIDELDYLDEIPNNVLNYDFDLPTIIRASGGGGAIAQLIFPNQEALDAAREACENGELDEVVCQFLGIS